MNKNNIEPSLFRVLKNQFKGHLQQEGNFRTIFSGRFGSGKTTFLEDFFAEEKESFLPITLHPVNYSIATNEDIFEYIKYDLLVEVIAHLDLNELNGYDLGLPEKAYLYLHHDLPNFFGKIISFLTPLGKLIDPSLAFIEKTAALLPSLKKAIDEHYDKLSMKTDEHRKMNEFFDRIKEKSASLYEETFLTHLLEKAITALKAKEKKIILLIEDLDRIDPEHIFRILNVFSAHFDSRTSSGENNFGIDVLVAVCDEENIRNIFSNRYGGNVDYSGYIDKFYSLSVFNFNYAELVHDYIRKSISSMIIEPCNNRRVPDSVCNTLQADGFLEYMLTILLDHKMISLRAINKVLQNRIVYAAIDVKFGRFPVNLSNCLIILELLILAEICGGVAEAKKHCQRLANLKEVYPKRGKVFERLLTVIIFNNRTDSKDNNVLLPIESIVYKGVLAVEEEEQYYVQGLSLSGSFGTSNIDSVKTNQFFDINDRVLALIERNPKLRLSSYYHV